MAETQCRACGAPMALDAGTKFAKCPYCKTQSFIDRSGIWLVYLIPFQGGFSDQSQAMQAFKQWASRPDKAKELETEGQVSTLKMQYFPVYLFRRDEGGAERVYVRAAKSTMLPGLNSLKVPAGDLKAFTEMTDTRGGETIQPDLGMGAYLGALPGNPKEQALVFFPIWNIEYSFRGKRHAVVIDGSGGEVFAADFPRRKGAPYAAVAALSFLGFLGLGTLLQDYTVLAVAGIAGISVASVVGGFWVASKR